ncbi:MAG: TPR repeat protein [Myxococcota bacterium]|jgi:TPR repeat protein
MNFRGSLLWIICALVAIPGCGKKDEAAPPDPLGDCTGDQAAVCMTAGVKLQNGEGVDKDVPGALALFDRVCAGGQAKGCTLAAHIHRNGAEGVPKDEAKALTLYEQICTRDGEANACFHAGNAYGIEQLGASSNPSKALTYLQKACDGGVQDGCKFAEMVKATVEKSPKALEPRCAGGDAEACTELGMIYWRGSKSVKVDVEKARASLTRACDAGHPDGCAGLGMTWERGEKPNGDTAVAAYIKGCTAGSGPACERVGKLSFDGKLVTQDYARAAEYSGKACTKDVGNGCFLLAVLHKRGMGVTANQATARRHLDKACRLGIKAACKFLESAPGLPGPPRVAPRSPAGLPRPGVPGSPPGR